MKSYAQYGEDLLIARMFDNDYFAWRPGPVVEIGAGNGEHLSNTALFRERGWHTTLVESDPDHFAALEALERANPHVTVYYKAATPENINILVPSDAKFVSIDVDGDDIFLFEALEHQPLAVCIEYNPTMPRHMDVAPARLGLKIGASIPALRRIARAKGYGLVHASPCNAIFAYGLDDAEVHAPEPEYVVATEYFTGRPLVLGTAPWGVTFDRPYPPEDVTVR